MDVSKCQVIFVDIDDTICYYDFERNGKAVDYSLAKPHKDRIEKINKLYNDGKTIIYWTARGTKTGKQWFHLILNQLNNWGCKFHELRLGKPYYDLFIDDKNINSDNFFS